jgi:hypothetical protein
MPPVSTLSDSFVIAFLADGRRLGDKDYASADSRRALAARLYPLESSSCAATIAFHATR